MPGMKKNVSPGKHGSIDVDVQFPGGAKAHGSDVRRILAGFSVQVEKIENDACCVLYGASAGQDWLVGSDHELIRSALPQMDFG